MGHGCIAARLRSVSGCGFGPSLCVLRQHGLPHESVAHGVAGPAEGRHRERKSVSEPTFQAVWSATVTLQLAPGRRSLGAGGLVYRVAEYHRRLDEPPQPTSDTIPNLSSCCSSFCSDTQQQFTAAGVSRMCYRVRAGKEDLAAPFTHPMNTMRLTCFLLAFSLAAPAIMVSQSALDAQLR